MIRRANTLATILLVIGCLAGVVEAAEPQTPGTAVLPELRVEGGFDNAQVHDVRVEDATGDSPRIIISGDVQVEGMPTKGRDGNRYLYWHFRLANCKGRTVRFEVYYARASLWPAKALVPVVRYGDGRIELVHDVEAKSFGPAKGRFMEKVGIFFTHRFRDEPAYISYTLPLTNDVMAAVAQELKSNKWTTVNELGRTPLFNQPLQQIVVTDPSVPDRDKRGLWFWAGEDPWEMPGCWAAVGLVRFAASDDPLAAEIRKRFIISAIPMVNPDAVHRGDTNFYLDPNGAHLINSGLSWARTDIPAHEMIKAALRRWHDDGRAMDLMVSMHSSCFWASMLRLDFAYDPAEARRFVDEVYGATYVPWSVRGKEWTGERAALLDGSLGRHLGAEFWPDRLIYFSGHIEQIIFPKGKLLGQDTPAYPDGVPHDLIRLQKPDLLLQGELFGRAAARFYGVRVPADKIPPILMGGDVDTYWGAAGSKRIYTVLYRDTEGRVPEFVRLHVGERTVEMQKQAGEGPVKGLLFKAAVPLAEGDNAFWFETSNGPLQRRYPPTGSFPGPYVSP